MLIGTVLMATPAAAKYYDPDAPECHRLARVAASVGWPDRELAAVRKVAARESLCSNKAINHRDPYGGSHCAMQINGSNRTFLIRQRIIRADMKELRDSTARCLKAALALWKRHGWRPWAGSSSAP